MNIYQLYYDDKQLVNCFDKAEKVKCINMSCKEDLKKNPFFENKYIAEIIPTVKDNDYYGVLSHKFERKTGFNYSDMERLDKTEDVVSFFRHKTF